MPEPLPITKTEITTWLRESGKDREWLAGELKVSLSIVNQWLAPKGQIPDDRLVSIRQLMERESAAPLIGDPEGNQISFTIVEFERIEATRQRLHYDARTPMYRDAILAFIEADEAAQKKIIPISQSADPPDSASLAAPLHRAPLARDLLQTPPPEVARQSGPSGQ